MAVTVVAQVKVKGSTTRNGRTADFRSVDTEELADLLAEIVKAYVSLLSTVLEVKSSGAMLDYDILALTVYCEADDVEDVRGRVRAALDMWDMAD